MKRFLPWPGMVFGLIGLNVCVVSVTLYLAHADPSFAVEPEYDRKALAWDESARLAARSAALGWAVAVQADPSDGRSPVGLTVRLIGRDGSAITDADVELEAFASRRASDRRRIVLAPGTGGVYEGSLGPAEPGLWELRITAQRGGERFEARVEQRVEGARKDTP